MEALRGHVTPHHRAMLKLHLGIIAALESALEQLDASVGKALAPISYAATLLKTMLVTAAWAAVRKKDSYLRAQFLRLKARRGPKKAILAVAASMLTAAYYMLRRRVEYQDLGSLHYENRDRSRTVARLVRRLQDLGCQVELKHAA